MNETPSQPAGFDPSRAGQLRVQALEAFQAQGRKIIRCYYLWLSICIALACVYMYLFSVSRDVKSWIFYGVLFLVMFEGTVLIKLWYWVVNNKLALLRETKLLRMDLALQKGAMDALEELARVESPFEPLGVSMRERLAWRAGIYLLALAIGVIFGFASMHSRFSRFLDGNGSGEIDRPDAARGVWVVRFEPVGDFAPATPGEFLRRINQSGLCYSGENGVIGYFRTTRRGGKLIGSFLASDPDQLKVALTTVPGLRVISIEKLTPEQLAAYERQPQESLDSP